MRLVDADALIADINRFTDWDTVDGITATTVLRQTITDIKNAPTVNVCSEYDIENHNCPKFCKVISDTIKELKEDGWQPVREGHWILNEWGDFTCEFCDNTPSYHSDVYNMNYCPNCGAKLILDIKRFERHENG